MIRDTKTDNDLVLIELVDDGEVKSYLYLVDLDMKIGNNILKTAGIGGVNTKQEYWFQGWARKLFKETMDYLIGKKYDISMLFGIPDFYQRVGYTTVIPQSRIELSTDAAIRAESFYPVRLAEPKDHGDVIDFRNAPGHVRFGDFIRKKDWWGFTDKYTVDYYPEVVVVTDGNGIKGYAVYNRVNTLWNSHNVLDFAGSEKMVVYEMEAIDYKGYSSLLNYCASIAQKRNVANITVLAPPDHPFAFFCRGCGCTQSVFFPFNVAGMARLVNIHTTFEKLLPELKLRLQTVSFHGKQSIGFNTDIGSVGLVIEDTDVKISSGTDECKTGIDIDQSLVTSLIFGYKRIQEILFETKQTIEKDAVNLLDILFPAIYPNIGIVDFF